VKNRILQKYLLLEVGVFVVYFTVFRHLKGKGVNLTKSIGSKKLM